MARSRETSEHTITHRDFEPITDGSAEDMERVREVHLAYLDHALSVMAGGEVPQNPSEGTDSEPSS